MAKKREITVSKFNVTDAGCELTARIAYTVALFKGDPPVEHVMNIDLSMSKARLAELALSTVVIDEQKIQRELGTHIKILERTSQTLLYKDIYPGTRTRIVKEMSPEEILAKCKSNPAFKAKLMAELMADDDAE